MASEPTRSSVAARLRAAAPLRRGARQPLCARSPPAGHGYAELSAGARGVGRGLAAYELGARDDERLSVFTFAEALLPSTMVPEWQAGVGARVTW